MSETPLSFALPSSTPLRSHSSNMVLKPPCIPTAPRSKACDARRASEHRATRLQRVVQPPMPPKQRGVGREGKARGTKSGTKRRKSARRRGARRGYLPPNGALKIAPPPVGLVALGSDKHCPRHVALCRSYTSVHAAPKAGRYFQVPPGVREELSSTSRRSEGTFKYLRWCSAGRQKQPVAECVQATTS
jgi:hypothetical protein